MGRVDGACSPEHILVETNTEPYFVQYVYEDLLGKYSNDKATQIAIAGRVIKAFYPEAKIRSSIKEFVLNKDFLEDMREKDQKILAHLIENCTKDSISYKKDEYQNVLNIVHQKTPVVRKNFASKLWMNAA